MLKRFLAGLLLSAAGALGALALASNYERAVGYVLDSEGRVYENHPRDPGGPTKYGITIYDVRLYVKRGATADDVRRLTEKQALQIYHDKYWNHPCVRADDLPSGVDYSIFDYGVNSGVGRAGKVLRKVLGLPAGVCTVTDEVVAAAKKMGREPLINAINAERMRFLRGLGTFDVFGRGWTRRVSSVRIISLRMTGRAGASMRGLSPDYGPGKSYDFNPEDIDPEQGP